MVEDVYVNPPTQYWYRAHILRWLYTKNVYVLFFYYYRAYEISALKNMWKEKYSGIIFKKTVL